MADPVTMAGVGIGGSILQGFIGAEGAETQAQAQADAANFKAATYQYQAGVAQQNAQLAKQNANYALYSGEVQAQEMGLKVRAQIGSTKATQGAGGLDVNTGSNAAVRASEKEIGDQNVAIIRSNAAKVAYGYEVQAFQDDQQAAWDMTGSQFETKAAAYAKKAGDISAVSSIIGGVTGAASKFSSAKSAGIF